MTLQLVPLVTFSPYNEHLVSLIFIYATTG